MKTIKEHLKDATTFAMNKRELEKHCGNALAEIIRLESALQAALDEVEHLLKYTDINEFVVDRLRMLTGIKED
ncbi:MAG: hypothetical protein UT21_C0010G0004 [Candidatus Woesebacteria bacterium GW2011_GWA1_39_11b]|nr:MAG: hypothetical protein UT21_C0010G0004 [Candidatus Woesebacteria bacterium GW2011_GWA1_39_11b]